MQVLLSQLIHVLFASATVKILIAQVPLSHFLTAQVPLSQFLFAQVPLSHFLISQVPMVGNEECQAKYVKRVRKTHIGKHKHTVLHIIYTYITSHCFFKNLFHKFYLLKGYFVYIVGP